VQFCGKRATQTEQSRKHNQDTGRNLQITCSRPQVNDSGGARANGSSRLSKLGSTVKWGRLGRDKCIQLIGLVTWVFGPLFVGDGVRHTAAEMEGVLPFWGKTDTHYGVSALTTGFGFRSLCKKQDPLSHCLTTVGWVLAVT
jgi:hypothetical protein